VSVGVGIALVSVAICLASLVWLAWVVWVERRGGTDYLKRIRLPRSLPSLTTAGSIIAAMAAYVAASETRLRMSRIGRSADGIIVVPLLVIALVLGVFAATAATKRSSAADADSLVVATLASNDVNGDAVTETHLVTVTTAGKKKRVTVERLRTRVVKKPGGTSTLFESVVVPGASQTKTVTGPTKTVTGPTETITETVTTVLTVTETVEEDDDKGKP
jgi:hypothetical protein